jgi:hypothetical protein
MRSFKWSPNQQICWIILVIFYHQLQWPLKAKFNTADFFWETQFSSLILQSPVWQDRLWIMTILELSSIYNHSYIPTGQQLLQITHTSTDKAIHCEVNIN